ncbi:MAG: NUDIX domain-containing protein [Candidatus Moranbacteria bacterium]|nr:NUDIX domain-containing protein [Candidatus Moranbacteria bacterium]
MTKIIFDLNSKYTTPLTLIYLIDSGKVLMLKRSPKKEMVAGEWLGLGGKLEPGEDLIDSAKREFVEETGLTIHDPVLRGTFTWMSASKYAGTLFIFTATKYEGDLLKKCDEGELAWQNIDTLEKLKGLAAHQKLFLPKILCNNSHFYCGIAAYDKDKLIRYTDNEQYFLERKRIT